MTHRLNPRGYTWQAYLRRAWWWLALLIGVGAWLIWWATFTGQMVFGFAISGFALLDFGWKHFGRYVREGWRSK
jgi:4-amino-4-deoxy-L-arabinose transferase-like glycosyltransferase